MKVSTPKYCTVPKSFSASISASATPATIDGRASGNATRVKVYRGLSGRLRRARYIANISRARWAEAVEEHERILAALEASVLPGLSENLVTSRMFTPRDFDLSPYFQVVKPTLADGFDFRAVAWGPDGAAPDRTYADALRSPAR